MRNLILFLWYICERDSKKDNLKRVNLVSQSTSRKNKLRQQILGDKKVSKNDTLLEKEDPWKNLIYSSIFRCVL